GGGRGRRVRGRGPAPAPRERPRPGARDGGRALHAVVTARAATVAATAAIALLLLARAAGGYVDPDVYHLMALARALIAFGRVPVEDLFAYVPTVRPTIQHEWGMGLILHALVSGYGAAGLLLLRYTLTAGIALACVRCARRRGASVAVLAAL